MGICVARGPLLISYFDRSSRGEPKNIHEDQNIYIPFIGIISIWVRQQAKSQLLAG